MAKIIAGYIWEAVTHLWDIITIIFVPDVDVISQVISKIIVLKQNIDYLERLRLLQVKHNESVETLDGYRGPLK